MNKTTKIWSKRFTPAKGNHWQEERSCNLEDVAAWIKIFSDDEPKVIFVTSPRRPAR